MLPWNAERGLFDWSHGAPGEHHSPSRDAFANLGVGEVVTSDAVLSTLSSNELHVMRTTDSCEYAQYLGRVALLTIDCRRFRDGHYLLFSEALRAHIDITHPDAALWAEYVKVCELQAEKRDSRSRRSCGVQ